MIKELLIQWDKNKNKLEDYFKNNLDEYYSYEQIVKLLFTEVINYENDEVVYDIEKMTVIDDGHYQGTEIFIIPEDTYQPSINEYVITNTYYGSCSGCDTLQAILYEKDLAIKINDLMNLALHLFQKLKPLG